MRQLKNLNGLQERNVDAMTELIEVNVANLSGEALGWAIGKAEGLDVLLAPPVYGNPWRVFVRYVGEVTTRDVRYAPQDSWADGGPLIEMHRIELRTSGSDNWWADKVMVRIDPAANDWCGFGPSALIAACRAIVAAKLGDTVQVPKELIP